MRRGYARSSTLILQLGAVDMFGRRFCVCVLPVCVRSVSALRACGGRV